LLLFSLRLSLNHTFVMDTILTGMYAWPSLERLPAIQQGISLPDNVAKFP
jgi:hypothetical protein